MENMRIAVTGATGHIGSNLIRKLVEDGYDIRVLIHNNPISNEGIDIIQIKGSLQNIDSLLNLCQGVDVVIHLAALISIGSESITKISNTNIDGTMNLLEAAKTSGVKKFIHFSSIHALVHEPFDSPMDESREIAINSDVSYERTKAFAEKWVLEQQSPEFDVVVLNPTSVIGPFDYRPSLMGEFIIGAIKGNIPGVVPGGYDWVDVRDIVDATIKTIGNGRGGHRYILSGNWLSIKGFADILIELSKKKKKLPVLPLWLARIGVPFLFIYAKIRNRKPIYTKESLSILQAGNKNIVCDKAKKELGFNPRPLRDTLTDTIHWFKENNYF